MATEHVMAKPAPTLREGVNVLFSRPEEIEEVQAHVFASFADAQEDKVVANTFFRGDSLDDLPERGEGFDSVLSVVVVPWYTVKDQKRKELVAILLQPFLDLYGCLALQGHVRDLPIESIHRSEEHTSELQSLRHL